MAESLAGKVALVTGVGDDMGFAWHIAKALNAAGARIVLASHPRLVGAFAGFLNVILFFPSGAIYPIESFPPWQIGRAHV